jgi:hypothetical protein
MLVRASLNCRIIAAELIGQGADAGRDGAVSTLIGLRLAHGRAAIDGVLLDIAAAFRDDPNGLEEIGPRTIEFIRRFNDNALDLAETMRTLDATELDTSVPRVLAPLVAAVTPFLDGPPVSHWPLAAGAATPVAATPAQTFEMLEASLAGCPMRDDTRAALATVLDFLKRGAHYPELTPQVEAGRRRVADVLEAVQRFARASWLDETTATEYADRLHAALSMYADPSRRRAAGARLTRLAAVSLVVDRVTTLDGKGLPARRVAAAVVAADHSADDPSVPGDVAVANLGHLAGIFDRMIDYRTRPAVDLPRDLRVVHQKLARLYETAEDALIDGLAVLADDPDPFTHPATATLVSEHAQYLRDLDRLRQAPAWIETVTSLEPRATASFQRQLRRMSNGLLDTNRRPDAVRAMDHFEQQRAMFVPMPFESELASAAEPAIVASGGLASELLDVIAATRRAWAESWGRGDAASAAANDLLVLYRLTRRMEDAVELIRLEGATPIVDRWAAWEMPRPLLSRASAEIPTRLKLATASAVAGRGREVVEQLGEIDREAPMVLLVGRLSVELGPALDPLPGGVTALLGQLVSAPSPNAWMLERRADLAALCRYAVEADVLREQGREEEAEAVQRYVNAVATDLLRVFDEGTGRIPAVPGFDGSARGTEGQRD